MIYLSIMARRIDWQKMKDDLEGKLNIVTPLIRSTVDIPVELTIGKTPPRIYATLNYPELKKDNQIEDDQSKRIEEITRLGERTKQIGKIMRENGLKSYTIPDPHFKLRPTAPTEKYTLVYGFDRNSYKI